MVYQRKIKPVLSAVAVIRYPDDRILLTKRADDPCSCYGGYWCLAGGKAEKGETPEQNIIREVKEETGLDVEIEACLGSNLEWATYRGKPSAFFCTVYVVTPKDPNQKVVLQEEECSEWMMSGLREAMGIKLAFKHNKVLEDFNDYMWHEHW